MSFDASALPTYIRDVPDFPQPGVLFKDITTLLKEPAAFRGVIDLFAARYQDQHIDVVAGIESRGFIFGAPLAYALGVGFVPIRKFGKLPHETVEEAYELEYGSATIEIHRDAIAPGARVVIADDLLATGGTMRASCNLVEKLGGQVAGLAFLAELTFLNGRARLTEYDIAVLITY